MPSLCSNETLVEKSALLPSADLAAALAEPVETLRDGEARDLERPCGESVAGGSCVGDGGDSRSRRSNGAQALLDREHGGSVAPDQRWDLNIVAADLPQSPQLEQEVKVKLVFLGGKGVGKSAVVRSIRNMPFVSTLQPTVGYDIFSLLYTRTETGRQVRAELWDVSHLELSCDEARWARIVEHAAGFVLVCDASNYRSFGAVDAWRSRIASSRSLGSVKMLLLANKADVQPTGKVNKQYSLLPQVLEKYTRIAGFSAFATTSAKSGVGIHPSFDTLVQGVMATAMMYPECQSQWASESIPYLYASWPSPADTQSSHVHSANSQTSGTTLSDGSLSASITHRMVIERVMRLHHVVEDWSDLALPTEAFAAQETAAVLTTRRPEHRQCYRNNTNTEPSALSSVQNDRDEANAVLSTHVVILGASLRRCATKVYETIRTALENAAGARKLESQCEVERSHVSHSDVADRTGQARDSTGFGEDRETEEFLTLLEHQRQQELDQIDGVVERLPGPADADFVEHAPTTLSTLQALRRQLVRNVANWQYAFQTLSPLAQPLPAASPFVPQPTQESETPASPTE
eukprot:INCI10728.1.p1 GENE.INCI10728.1~~INCI10728.1.p1  ORF type:complete len:577 (+),score=83.18 INCI10728.1:160-1890(+)